MTSEERKALIVKRKAVCLRISEASVIKLRDTAAVSGIKQYKLLEMGIDLAAKKVAAV